MGYLRNAFKLSQSQRRVMVGLVLILVLTSNRVQAAEPNVVLAQSTPTVDTAQTLAGDTQNRGFVIPFAATNDLPDSANVVVARTYHVTLTAYSSDPNQTDSTPFISADGSHVYDGMIAANFLKFGTRVRIPALFGDKVFVVHDRMNQRFNNRVDIWMPSTPVAKDFGIKRDATIEIL